MYTPGTILRLAREERKLSISDAKYFAKIRESAIIAMENDEYDRFPAAYMQTFLPSYADFLGVSHYRLAEAFKATLPEYGYLTRSLYSRTLRQISLAQSKLEYERLHPAIATKVARGARIYGLRVAALCLCVALLGWALSSLNSSSSMLGVAFAGALAPTPEELRGVRFDELERSPEGVAGHNDAMQTVRLASLVGVEIDMETLASIAFKQADKDSRAAALGRGIIGALERFDEENASSALSSPSFDASSRSISSIASAMLVETATKQASALPASDRASSEAASAEPTAASPSVAPNALPSALPIVLPADLRSIEIRGLAEATAPRTSARETATRESATRESASKGAEVVYAARSGIARAIPVVVPVEAQTPSVGVQRAFSPSPAFLDVESVRRSVFEALRAAREASRFASPNLSSVEAGESAPEATTSEDSRP